MEIMRLRLLRIALEQYRIEAREMKTHQEIDARSLRLAQAVVAKIDLNPGLLQRARDWAARQESVGVKEWLPILEQTWPFVREQLLAQDEEGRRLRQNSPFVGILTPQERWALYRESNT